MEGDEFAPTDAPARSHNWFELLFESRWGYIVISFVLIPVCLLVALLLPPISLYERITSPGYTRVGSSGGVVEGTGGAQMTFRAEDVPQPFRAKFTEVSRSTFLRGDDRAAKSVPPSLVLAGPVYQLQRQGPPPTQMTLTLPLPAETGPHLLDLYTWRNNTWEWQPNQKIAGQGVLTAELTTWPELVVVMHSYPTPPQISTDYASGDILPSEAQNSLTEVNPQGLYLDEQGEIAGSLEGLPPEIQTGYALVPTLRNWDDDGVIYGERVNTMLRDKAVRAKHVAAIAALIEQSSYQGIDLDYRGIDPTLRDEYSLFLAELDQALPISRRLSVRVELPRPVVLSGTSALSETVAAGGSAFDTGAYDWEAIGRTADIVKLPVWPDPESYKPGGAMEQMLAWGVGRINRYKLQLLLSTYAIEYSDHLTRELSYQQALGVIGQVTIAGGGSNVVNPGQSVEFTLSHLAASDGILFDGNSGIYWLAYQDEAGQTRRLYLENATSIARKLQFATTYNLGGVTIQNLLDPQVDSRIWGATGQFADLVLSPVESEYSITWQVKNKDGGTVIENVTGVETPSYNWIAPDESGAAYHLNVGISSDPERSELIASNQLELLVATYTTTPTPIPTVTPVPTATPTPSPTISATAVITPTEPTPPPQPTFTPTPIEAEAPTPTVTPNITATSTVTATQTATSQAAVGGGDTLPAAASLPFDYGIQADPRGNKTSNITHIQQLGFRWVKLQMAWSEVEPANGEYHWGTWDDVIGAYHQSGIKVMLSVTKAPRWARPSNTNTSADGPPHDPATYADFAAQVATRYQGQVQAMEVWNEQNMNYEWGHETLDPARYMALLAAAYTAIKAANPEMIVVSGAPTPTGAPPPTAMDDLAYLEQMYLHGLKEYSDAIGAHPSGFANPPDALFTGEDYDPTRGYDDHRSFFFRNTMESYRQMMVKYNDTAKTIWPTEFGWPVWRYTGDRRFEFARDTSPEEQAQYTVTAYQMAKEWGWVGTMFLWNLDYGVTSANTELANFSILTTGGAAPVYHSLAAMPK